MEGEVRMLQRLQEIGEIGGIEFDAKKVVVASIVIEFLSCTMNECMHSGFLMNGCINFTILSVL